MNRFKRLFQFLSELSAGRWGIVVISLALQASVLMVFGLVLAIKYGHLLALSMAIVLTTVVITIPLFVVNRRKRIDVQNLQSNGEEKTADELVKASTDWSPQELMIWEMCKSHNLQLLDGQPQWSNFDELGLDILTFVATHFDKKALDFSIPEALQLFEEISRRYKLVVKENIPLIEVLKISHIKAGYQAYDKYGELGQKAIKAAIWANHAKNLYLNQAKFALDMMDKYSNSSMTSGVFDEMQFKAKQTLLDEVAAVAIDLYSGRFKFEESELEISQSGAEDLQRLAAQIEPIRIVLVGQTSSGKSSLINTLKQQLLAEVDELPSTAQASVYRVGLEAHELHVVDLKGLDGDKNSQKQMLKEMTQADLVLWILKANQSARELDMQLKASLDAFYLEPKNISRKKPRIIAVLNQVDKLKPTGLWQPPYELEDLKDSKVKTIVQALAYNQKLLKPDLILPLSISSNKAQFGVEHLIQILSQEIDSAGNVQRNRQRVEAMKRSTKISKQLGRAINTGKKVAPAAVKAASPQLAKAAVKQIIKK